MLRFSGRGVVAGLAVLATTLSVLAAPLPSSAQTKPRYTDVVSITLPADNRATFGDSYHAARDGGARVHRAADLMAPKLTKAYAAVAGTVCYQNGVREPMPSWGYSLTVCGDDGRQYRYLHLNNDNPGTDDGLGGPEWAYAPGIRQGVRVARGQWVGYIGDSGNAEATAPHLHFEIEDKRVVDPYGTNRMNPYPSLQDARRRGDLPRDPGGGGYAGVDRVAGADRVATAVALSERVHKAAKRVVIAPAGSFADAAVAGPLAGHFRAPVLTTGPKGLDPRVAAELKRLGATSAFVVGDTASITDRVVRDLRGRGLSVERLAGVNAADTAAVVAQRVWQLQAAAGTRTPRRALLALGAHRDPAKAWPDALLASYHGAASGRPLLLAGVDRLPGPTTRALSGVEEVTIVGGKAAVSDMVAADASRLTSRVRRLAGATRYTTATAVADDLLRAGSVRPERVWAATGRNWADAVTAGPTVARTGQVLVLVDGKNRGADADAGRWVYSKGLEITRGRVIGGTAAVNQPAATRLSRRIS
jgi:hypothetical protein